jgi:predicted DNA-binding protein with PD1-like motif
MKSMQADLGRVFILRLEDGDRIPDAIQEFAAQNGVERALVAMLGGASNGKVVSGPRDGNERPVSPMMEAFSAVHEAKALGTIFPDASGTPKLHMHASLGRAGNTITGCTRTGLTVWQIGEVVLLELLCEARRSIDPETGFELLDLG